MLAAFPCPSCDAFDWEPLERHVYRAGGGSGSSDPGRQWADRLQRDFVFASWLPGQDKVVLQELLCARCGLVTYAPRPSADDLREKYAALQRLGIEPGAPGEGPAGDDRPARLAETLRDRLPARDARVLDVGGGDGRLLAGLVARGVACAVVDYNRETVAGVAKLGDTLDDVPAGERFDAVVLSHVLEHVASPREMVRAVAGLLRPDGVVYAEVPVELWRGTPVAVDPVTHVNHFAGPSLRALLRCNGYRVLTSTEGMGSYNGHPLEVTSAVATRGRETNDEDPAALVRRRLSPSMLARARRRGATLLR